MAAHREPIAIAFERARPDPFDERELIHRFKRPMTPAIINNSLRFGRADPRQRCGQCRSVGGVEIDGTRRRRCHRWQGSRHHGRSQQMLPDLEPGFERFGHDASREQQRPAD